MHCVQKQGGQVEQVGPQRCGGPAIRTWLNKAVEAARAIDQSSAQHHIMISFPVFWCAKCGAFGERAPKLLAKPCRGRQAGQLKRSALRAQLRDLRAGIHPETRRPLPLPVPLKD